MAARARRDGGQGIRTAAARLYVLGGLVWAAAALVILAFGESLLALLLGPAYAPYWSTLLLLWIGNGVYFVGRVYGVGERVSQRTSVELLGSLGGLLVLVAALPLIPAYGVVGAALLLILVQVGCVVSQVAYARGFGGTGRGQ
jgi:O-antigen/teichoic acid export membrane protein